MSVSVAAVRTTTMGTMTRLLLLAGAVVAGFIGGLTWSLEISAWAYDGFLKLFADPGVQITSMAMGVGVAYLLGLVHVTTICWLPAALAAVPLAQEARTDREWLKTAGVLVLSMVAVTALFGVLLSAPASLFAGIIGSRRTMSQILQPTIIATGILMVVAAAGELGLIRRLLPSMHAAPGPVEVPTDGGPRTRYRRAAIMGLLMAATFGIICPKPLYLGLLVYVAVVGSAAYGALALGAYGLGLASSVALGGLVLIRVSRAARFNAWLASREETFHLVQGIVFAALGAMAFSFSWLKYTIPPA
jgi:cytochrome c biogenesis protein CcdA